MNSKVYCKFKEHLWLSDKQATEISKTTEKLAKNQSKMCKYDKERERERKREAQTDKSKGIKTDV